MVNAWELWKIRDPHKQEKVVVIVNLTPLEGIPVECKQHAVIIDAACSIFLNSTQLICKIGIMEGPLLKMIAEEYILARNLS